MTQFPAAHQLYPLLFEPIYMRRIWGGDLMTKALGRTLPPTADGQDPVGEAWEISDRDDAQSVVVNGALSGATLGELAKFYRQDLLGSSGADGRFPLLIKLIDAGERLSLQVHPDEAYCREVRDGSEPKTELWHVVAAAPGGEILAGLAPQATRFRLTEELNSARVVELLQRYPSIVGDSFFIASGTLHAIGAGNLILEIQQNSDTTFRVSDWGRIGKDGKPRKLHVEQGLKAIDFFNRKSPRIPASADQSMRNRKTPLVDRNCFRIDQLQLSEDWPDRTGGSQGSAHVLSVAAGSVTIQPTEPGRPAEPVQLECGRSTLLPAALGSYVIHCVTPSARVLKTTF